MMNWKQVDNQALNDSGWILWTRNGLFQITTSDNWPPASAAGYVTIDLLMATRKPLHNKTIH